LLYGTDFDFIRNTFFVTITESLDFFYSVVTVLGEVPSRLLQYHSICDLITILVGKEGETISWASDPSYLLLSQPWQSFLSGGLHRKAK
jgi:hypothetical protein